MIQIQHRKQQTHFISDFYCFLVCGLNTIVSTGIISDDDFVMADPERIFLSIFFSKKFEAVEAESGAGRQEPDNR